MSLAGLTPPYMLRQTLRFLSLPHTITTTHFPFVSSSHTMLDEKSERSGPRPNETASADSITTSIEDDKVINREGKACIAAESSDAHAKLKLSNTKDSRWPELTMFNCDIFVTAESGERSRPDPSEFQITIGRDDQIFIVLPLDKPNAKSPWTWETTATLLMISAGTLVVDVIDNTTALVESVLMDVDEVLAAQAAGIDRQFAYVVKMDCTSILEFTFSFTSTPYCGPQFVGFEMHTDDMSYDELVQYYSQLERLLRSNDHIYLHILRQNFEGLRRKCHQLAHPNVHDRLGILLLLARIFNHEFHKMPCEALFRYSRALYQDWANDVVQNLSDNAQTSLINGLACLHDSDHTKLIRMYELGIILATQTENFVATPTDEGTLIRGVNLLEAVSEAAIKGFKTADLDSILKSAACFQECHPNQPALHPLSDLFRSRYELYVHLSDVYRFRYLLSNGVLDLDATLICLSKAMEIKDRAGGWVLLEDRPAILFRQASCLYERFMMRAEKCDLEQAQRCIVDALSIASGDLFYHALHANILAARYRLLDDIADLDQAIQIGQDLLDIVPAQHPLSSNLILSLVPLLILRSKTFSSLNFEELPLQSIPDDGYYQTAGKNSEKALNEVNRALALLKRLGPKSINGLPNQRFLTKVALTLQMRHRLSRDRKDLDMAINALSQVPPDNRWENAVALHLGKMYAIRYRCEGDIADLHLAISVLADGAKEVSAEPIVRFLTARLWTFCARLLEGDAQVSSLMDAYTTMMSILPSVATVGMAISEQHDVLRMTSFNILGERQTGSWSSMIAMTPTGAAAFAIEQGRFPLAIEWLESGRSIVWNHLLQLRIPMGLTMEDKELWEKLAKVGEELSVLTTRTGVSFLSDDSNGTFFDHEVEGQRRRKLVAKWKEALAESPSLAKALLPKDFVYLSAAASDVITVVINVAHTRCDALIMFPSLAAADGVRHVALPLLSLDQVKDMQVKLARIVGLRGVKFESDTARNIPLRLQAGENMNRGATLRKILRLLWFAVALPIINSVESVITRMPLALKNSITKHGLPHVRWCPTGHLAFLPLHAAGDYNDNNLDSNARVYHHCISSYIPTLNSISSRARNPSPSNLEESTTQILAVSCAIAKGQATIGGSTTDIEHIKTHCAESPLSELTVLGDEQASAGCVLEAMKKSHWVHFACHGIQDSKTPVQSAFLLANGTRLTLSDIAAVNHPHAELAFLAACETAEGYDQLPSESVHLAAGMLLAGYQSVIATMWSINDKETARIVADFYGCILRRKDVKPDYRESAVALHLALSKLREKETTESLLLWMPFIHMGV